MANTLLYLTVVLGLAGLILLLFVGIAQYKEQLSEKQKVTRKFDAYRHTVSQYRLSKMLSFIGIQLDDYITRIPQEAIQKHIINCANCPDIPTCDRCLRDGKYVGDMNFCPNYQSLMAFSRIMPSVE